MRRYLALCQEWAQRPPTRWLKAAELGYKPPPQAGMTPGMNDMPKLKPTRPTSPEALERKRQIILAARARGEPTVALPEEEQAQQPAPETNDLAAVLRRHGGSWRG